jgi:pyruvate dehydrogenase E2 component (dihydrolipoamide acetyltransferase)
MATKVMMPKLSDTMEEGIILRWVRKEGDPVKQGEIIAEIQTDKADMELEAYDSGVLRKVVVPEGGKVAIGELIAVIGEPDEDISSMFTPSVPGGGKKLEKGEPTTTVGQKGIESQPKSSAEEVMPKPADIRIRISPLARRLASEHHVDLLQVRGTGPDGRILKRDVESLLALIVGVLPLEVPQSAAIPSGTQNEYEDVELTLMRKTVAKRMHESKATVPHFYVTMEINMDKAIEFRKDLNEVGTQKVTFTDLIVKSAAKALLEHPKVNSSYLGDRIRQNKRVNIGVAVALDDGLITPVVRNCELKTLEQIASEIKDLADRAKERKVRPEEFQDGTFTISNLGMFDVENFAAIINPPEGAILAVGRIAEKPVAVRSEIVLGHTMKVTLSCDHRVIDGAVGAQFLQELKKILESPISLLL